MDTILRLVAGACCLLAQPALAQSGAAEPPAAAPVASPRLVTIKRDTPLDLVATREISTAQLKQGDQFTLSLNQPVAVGGVTVLPFMTPATGEVTLAAKAGGLGRNGSLTAQLLYLTLGDVRIPIQGSVSTSGGGAGSAALAVAFSGIVGLFHRGNNAKIKAGEHVPAFVAEDVVLDLAASPVRRVEMKLVPVESPGAPAPQAAK